MANWQHIDELHDISADLPRFTLAFRTFHFPPWSAQISAAGPIAFHCAVTGIRAAERWRRGFEQCGGYCGKYHQRRADLSVFKLHEPVCVCGTLAVFC